ncbi:hypothetical protein [Kaistella carnis]|uniref:hypothetical protein n=1 Tax=Kaistella carnis TaxID=1241979 RepID=UPI0028ABA97A|nr:hypothetical protein [Kaistella carnis]
MEKNDALIAVVNNLQITNKNTGSETDEKQFELLVEFIDDLIRNDFNRLLSILYRVDISEEKLKLKLAQNKETQVPSAEIIAHLLIDRAAEKMVSRKRYRKK